MLNSDKQSLLAAANLAIVESWRGMLNLPVALTVELGRTRLTARALLKLEANSIVQLSRSTGEGVDVLAGDEPLAHGEIIMVEDRTGVRINEIVVRRQT